MILRPREDVSSLHGIVAVGKGSDLVRTGFWVLSKVGIKSSLLVGWLVNRPQTSRVGRNVGVSTTSVVVVDDWLGMYLGQLVSWSLFHGYK